MKRKKLGEGIFSIRLPVDSTFFVLFDVPLVREYKLRWNALIAILSAGYQVNYWNEIPPLGEASPGALEMVMVYQ
jgi:hypothetical protein